MRLSCNGCRVLRKGCSDDCSIRPCLQWIKSPDAQSNATVFLAKFYGRAGLLNLINAGGPAPEKKKNVFRSLLYEACGRIVNPIYGSVGLLWSGKWHLCQAAVDAVLKGDPVVRISDEETTTPQILPHHDIISNNSNQNQKKKRKSSSSAATTCCNKNKMKKKPKMMHHQHDSDDDAAAEAASHVTQADHNQSESLSSLGVGVGDDHQEQQQQLGLDLTLAFVPMTMTAAAGETVSPAPAPAPAPDGFVGFQFL
ncbi:hypothetical protein PR202_gb09654 [Eleusine coracana subsp. coracana]|uniref:LOB domain-containing protein n=1 Tax=Eleusine coracana subsp. coracana TaxID=191504 RepID=A0AAV5EID3_ELECO|nr:hypothetical protein QOZ80_5BG0409240 [Eleusine coracana subsp. coracana]GJN22118.1 hypothetical protein PR202_gb09654 [Eleusine coracana subsp. coracana]